jgi:hypothetical protein
MAAVIRDLYLSGSPQAMHITASDDLDLYDENCARTGRPEVCNWCPLDDSTCGFRSFSDFSVEHFEKRFALVGSSHFACFFLVGF